jgi:hypothetical protein
MAVGDEKKIPEFITLLRWIRDVAYPHMIRFMKSEQEDSPTYENLRDSYRIKANLSNGEVFQVIPSATGLVSLDYTIVNMTDTGNKVHRGVIQAGEAEHVLDASVVPFTVDFQHNVFNVTFTGSNQDGEFLVFYDLIKEV